MASEIIKIHPETPEMRYISKVADALKNGAVILYPTDTGYALGCQLSDKNAIARIRRLRNISEKKSLTFICEDLSNISEFAKIDNQAYRTIKSLIPGPYTFILPASRLVPKFAQNPKRSTAGIRVPDNTISKLLLKELGQPLISITAKSNEDESSEIYETADEIIQNFEKLVDYVIICDRYDFTGESTVIDMTSSEYEIIREGAGYKDVEDLLIIE
ncbi:MAG: threonylcarbamoyl-AMP synthase [Sneathiellales bacterium]|nr:threonylcarbamoyl-AMP synthase [Sneathiellales bacterium]